MSTRRKQETLPVMSSQQKIKLFPQQQQTLHKTFNKYNIDSDIRHAVHTLLHADNVRMTPPFNKDYIKLLTVQPNIGIGSIYFGIMSKL